MDIAEIKAGDRLIMADLRKGKTMSVVVIGIADNGKVTVAAGPRRYVVGAGFLTKAKDADALAEYLKVGCDYCGSKALLERYDSPRVMDNGLRCVDGKACSDREIAAMPEEE